MLCLFKWKITSFLPFSPRQIKQQQITEWRKEPAPLNGCSEWSQAALLQCAHIGVSACVLCLCSCCQGFASVLATGELMATETWLFFFLHLSTPACVAHGRLFLCIPLHSVGPQLPLGHPAVSVTQTLQIKQCQRECRCSMGVGHGESCPLVVSMSLSTANLNC